MEIVRTPEARQNGLNHLTLKCYKRTQHERGISIVVHLANVRIVAILLLLFFCIIILPLIHSCSPNLRMRRVCTGLFIRAIQTHTCHTSHLSSSSKRIDVSLVYIFMYMCQCAMFVSSSQPKVGIFF